MQDTPNTNLPPQQPEILAASSRRAQACPAPAENTPPAVTSPKEPSAGKAPRPVPKRSARRSPNFSTDDATRIREPIVPEKAPETPAPAEKKPPQEKKPAPQEPKTRDRGGITLSLIKALIYIAAVLAVSGVIGVTGIRWGNDIFAFVKSEHTATVTIPEFATPDQIAQILKDNGLIEEPGAFSFWMNFKYGDDNLTIVPGSYELKSTMNYDQMIYQIRAKKPPRQIVTVTIPEGYTVDQIIDLMVNEYHIGTREGYVAAINEYQYDYDFIEKLNQLELSPHRKYRLEGYLFPAKYDVYTDLSEVGVIDYFLRAFEQRFEDSYYERLAELNMTIDQAITLASLIQAEGKFDSDYYYISSVFHNRLNSKNMQKLESDATIQYVLPERKEDLSQADLDLDDPYNTYLYPGLTPGAICNPGLEALHAALYPEESKYLYFVADIDGHSLFAETNAGHEKNKAQVKAQKEAAKLENS